MKKRILLNSCFFVSILFLSLNISAQTGSSLLFDGIDDHVELATRVVPSTGNFTVEFMVNTSSAATIQEFISQGTILDGFYIGTDVNSMIRCGNNWDSTGITLPLNQWVHLALVKIGTNGILYLKGGDLKEEFGRFYNSSKFYELKDFFSEEFFETKKVVYFQWK